MSTSTLPLSRDQIPGVVAEKRSVSKPTPKTSPLGVLQTGTCAACSARTVPLKSPQGHHPLAARHGFCSFNDVPINVLTGSGYDPVTHTAELKVCPVRVEALAES